MLELGNLGKLYKIIIINMKQITDQQIEQVQVSLQNMNFIINQLTGVQSTSDMLQSLPDIEDKKS